METITGRIVATKHIKNTPVGNGRYLVAIVTQWGGGEIVETAPNASIAYGIDSRELRETPHTFELNKRRQITRARTV